MILIYEFYLFTLQVADQENEQRRRLELAAMNANNKTNEDVLKKNKVNQKKQQVCELETMLANEIMNLDLRRPAHYAFRTKTKRIISNEAAAKLEALLLKKPSPDYSCPA